ncbi:glutamate 5-kinase, partial [Bacillus inaquosorum]|nr:glutamate 5-kinase [Bacillus inaquosorum]
FKIVMASGIKGFLGQADAKDILYKAVHQEAEGTYFEAEGTLPLNHKEQWIAFNSGPEGEMILSDDYSRKITNGQSSLYLDGVQEIKGKFKSGSVVRLMDSQGAEIGLGIVNYSSVQLQELDKKKELMNKAVIDQEAFVCHVDLSLPVY